MVFSEELMQVTVFKKVTIARILTSLMSTIATYAHDSLSVNQSKSRFC